MLATLKRSLGEAGAFIDDSHGENQLYKVLKALAEQGTVYGAQLATITAVAFGGFTVDQATKLHSLMTRVAVCGTAGQTDVRVRVNGTLVGGTATTLNTDADPTVVTVALDIELAAGDFVELVVTAAPTGGTGLTGSLRMSPVTVE